MGNQYLACQCEHVSHFDKPPAASLQHVYGATFAESKLRNVKSAGETMRLCAFCADAHTIKPAGA